MKHGFVKVAAATPDIKVADCTYNAESVSRDMKKAAGQGAKIVVFPELCLTGYTCSPERRAAKPGRSAYC